MITISGKLLFFILGVLSTLFIILLISIFLAIKEINDKNKFFKEYRNALKGEVKPLKGKKK